MYHKLHNMELENDGLRTEANAYIHTINHQVKGYKEWQKKSAVEQQLNNILEEVENTRKEHHQLD